MANKRAKTLDDKQFDRLVKHVNTVSVVPIRDLLMIALSFKAGLRIGEIALLRVDSMLDSAGRIADEIMIWSATAKGGKERRVPMHPMIRDTLEQFRLAHPLAECVAFSTQPYRRYIMRGEKIPINATFEPMSYRATKQCLTRLLKSFDANGLSTHSGRRTFGTTMARRAALHSCSLRDVQILMGHSSVVTTEAYIDISPNHRQLVMAG